MEEQEFRVRWPRGAEWFWLVLGLPALKWLGTGFAWPVTTACLALVFRKELGAVLLSLKEWVHFRIKRKDFEVQLDRVNQELDQAERKVAQAERQLPASESGQADVEDEPDADQDRLTGDEPLEPPLDAG